MNFLKLIKEVFSYANIYDKATKDKRLAELLLYEAMDKERHAHFVALYQKEKIERLNVLLNNGVIDV